ncbi:hypothetical protein C0Q70_09050 [Pomacea canaliculata]|uniref:RIIa domain-containing protein n=1 Tax=Pomacea canaliculata TaxID=400727 RepID=A0A2T7P8P9_POMCA|nr:ropporin-1-like protein [Pomacea canaliculata]PVD29793.1 hypothetical protein C0Q70_09050 [Pomacea canaliculata]
MPTNPDEPYYCSQQINIPPDLPDILKQFTKAAIRTQPTDVLAWSAAYFRNMAKGELPPVKERLEIPLVTQRTDTGLTPGILRVLNKQLGPKEKVTVAQIEEKWMDLSLPKEQFDDLIRISGLTGQIEWNRFLALASSLLTDNITDTMRVICETLTVDPEGGPARISYGVFKDLYQFLAHIDGEISEAQISEVLSYLQSDVEKQDGKVMPRNFIHASCPPLS